MVDAKGGVRGAFGHDYTTLKEALAPLCGERPLYVPPPGNAGDALIAANSYRFFEAIGLEVEHGYYRHTYPNRHVIFGGGGNLVPYYDDAKNFIERHAASAKSFTLLPHTVRGHEDLLAGLDGRFRLFAREQASYEHLRATARKAQVETGHDMAFFAAPEELAQSPLGGLARRITERRGLRFDLRQFQTWKKAVAERRDRGGIYPPKGPVLNAFRTDVETGGHPVPEDNLDVSEHFMHFRDHGPFMSRQIVGAMVRLISRYNIIRTDRLHIAVLAGLMGKDVEAWDNSYGKLELIRAASMEGFANIHFLSSSNQDSALFRER